jgi:hypothetical protein
MLNLFMECMSERQACSFCEDGEGTVASEFVGVRLAPVASFDGTPTSKERLHPWPSVIYSVRGRYIHPCFRGFAEN